MKTIRMKIDPVAPAPLAVGRMDAVRLDATTDVDIAAHQAADET